MVTYQIDIDGFIGNWEYSKEYVTRRLNENKGKPVNMRMNSNGGSISHGLSISDRVQEHGDVTVHLMGFNASAATVASLKAKKVCMSANGFYLIHKVMSNIDIWENLNADQLEVLIADLIADKAENEKIDQVLAQMYANKTGKTIEEMLALMKIGGWMNAKEAKQWGFVDEIIDSPEKLNMISMKEKLNVFGLPTNRINNEDLFTTKNKIQMKKQPIKINAVIGVDKLEADADGVFLNETQIDAIETKITELENSVSTATVAQTAAETRATTAEGTVATQATKITELETEIVNLNKGAGATTKKVNKKTDESDDDDDDSKNEFGNTIKASRELFNLLP
jgi:ATP-dependent protease ClpP protease subunit